MDLSLLDVTSSLSTQFRVFFCSSIQTFNAILFLKNSGFVHTSGTFLHEVLCLRIRQQGKLRDRFPCYTIMHMKPKSGYATGKEG